MTLNIFIYCSFGLCDRVYGVSTLITTAFDDGALLLLIIVNLIDTLIIKRL